MISVAKHANPANPPVLDMAIHISEHSDQVTHSNEVKLRGAINTKIEVVDFILDLIGYDPKLPLFEYRILEPSFGGGDFLLAIVDRVLCSWER